MLLVVLWGGALEKAKDALGTGGGALTLVVSIIQVSVTTSLLHAHINTHIYTHTPSTAFMCQSHSIVTPTQGVTDTGILSN